MHILLIDNYDSFTWNLHQLLRQAGASCIDVVKNDSITESQIAHADALVFSPGPGLPHQAGEMGNIIRRHADNKKMLGVCLGHQAIGEVFGAKIIPAPNIYHGEQTPLHIICNNGIFNQIPQYTLVGRYHSWIVDKKGLPLDLKITATDDKGIIMAMQHVHFDITGIQFHPESIMTPTGLQMIKNWMRS